MAANTKIEWCRHTWNPWIGCAEISPACDHCYAKAMMDDRLGKARWGAGEPRIRTSEKYWDQLLKWNRAASTAGRVDTVFCLSLGDIWDNEVNPSWRAEAFERMRPAKNLVMLLLSKRIGNAVKMAAEAGGLPPNVALGATMVNQTEWDRDAGKLRHAGERLGALFTFASMEPMLGPIEMGNWCPDWVICGGESGREPRDMPEAWAEHLMFQTHARGMSFFMKQMANKAPIPPHILVREYPKAIAA